MGSAAGKYLINNKTYARRQPRSGATLVVELFVNEPKPQRGGTYQEQDVSPFYNYGLAVLVLLPT